MNKKQVMEDIRRHLEENSSRLTPQREAVIQVLMSHDAGHLSAEEIYLHTKKLLPEIGLATVYRSLELLEKLSVVYKLEYGDGQSRYELVRSNEEHYHHHLICQGCGAISEFNDDLLGDIEARIAEEADFEVTDHCLRFFGYCSKCRSHKEDA